MIFVIFGGGGDLSWRKLIPSLYNLFLDNKLPETFTLLVVDRNEIKKEHFLEGINQFSRSGKANADQWQAFSSHLQFLSGSFDDLELYKKLASTCKEEEVIFYLATPPFLFGKIPEYLKQVGLNHKNARLVVEKPLGHDLESAKSLNAAMRSSFEEQQIFRIDHYLGKETVQNILAFRFANPIFEPIWNQKYIDFVTITVSETVGVEHRGDYYDHSGALRDMIQNHLMQLLCCIAMEPMLSFEADEIRNKKLDLLHAIRTIDAETVHKNAVRGQYGKGWVQGKETPSYRDEEGVNKNSNTETYAAIKLLIDNWRWQGVPFYLRTGKCLTNHVTNISIHFKKVPHQAFPPNATIDWHNGSLTLMVQPQEKIELRFYAKVPGTELDLKSVVMKFDYEESFHCASLDAYETLLYDVIKNNQTLFMRADQVEAAWKILMPIITVWEKTPTEFPNYEAGTAGPQEADWLIAQDGHSWPSLKETS
jgi:glucose-6-phosphate 1-dehydrogenase